MVSNSNQKGQFTKTHIHLIREEFELYLQQQGLRNTRQRKYILHAILTSKDPHMDAQALFYKVQKKDASIGISTVYRTLKILTEMRILVERRFTKDRSYFEVLTKHEEEHAHLICNQCSRIEEFKDPNAFAHQSKIAKSLGFEITHIKMELNVDCLKGMLCPYFSNHLKKR